MKDDLHSERRELVCLHAAHGLVSLTRWLSDILLLFSTRIEGVLGSEKRYDYIESIFWRVVKVWGQAEGAAPHGGRGEEPGQHRGAPGRF